MKYICALQNKKRWLVSWAQVHHRPYTACTAYPHQHRSPTPKWKISKFNLLERYDGGVVACCCMFLPFCGNFISASYLIYNYESVDAIMYSLMVHVHCLYLCPLRLFSFPSKIVEFRNVHSTCACSYTFKVCIAY